MSLDLTRTQMMDWDITWNSIASGAVDKVTVEIARTLKPIKVGSVGAQTLGDRLVDVGVIVKAEYREIDHTAYANLMSWTSGASLAGTPATGNVDLYSYAQVLNLHPSHLGGSDHTQDLNFIKAVPLITPPEGDGESFNKLLVEFHCYPDRSQLPSRVIWYVGPLP